MVQDANSGRKANKLGRFLGKDVAEYLGIELEDGTNKGKFREKLIVIKSASKDNDRFGITNKMLNSIEGVIIAKESQEGFFDLYMVPIESIIDTGRPAGGKNKGKVTNFSVGDAISNSEKIGAKRFIYER